LQQIHIDLDVLNNIAHTGVRRAVLFMGLGLNAAHKEDFNDYELSKLPIIAGQTGIAMEFFPSNLPVERVKVFKEEFATWITGCGLRELLEHYALFLDQMHDAALVILSTNEQLPGGDPQKLQKDFADRGIPRKLELLKQRFAIEPNDVDSIDSLYQARNCLTHDLGVVLPKRGNGSKTFNVSWRALTFFDEDQQTGKRCNWTDLVNKKTDEEIVMCAKMEKIEKAFPLNEKMVLTQQDLWEICFFFNVHAIPTALESFKTFLSRQGIKITASDVPNPGGERKDSEP
jgi:hypothetical protein